MNELQTEAWQNVCVNKAANMMYIATHDCVHAIKKLFKRIQSQWIVLVISGENQISMIFASRSKSWALCTIVEIKMSLSIVAIISIAAANCQEITCNYMQNRLADLPERSSHWYYIIGIFCPIIPSERIITLQGHGSYSGLISGIARCV